MKNNRKKDAAELKSKTDSWEGDTDPRLRRKVLYGYSLTRTELRDNISRLKLLLLDIKDKQELSTKRDELIEIHKFLEDFLFLQQGKFIDAQLGFMSKPAVERLRILNDNVIKIINNPTQLKGRRKGKFYDAKFVEMVTRSLADAQMYVSQNQ